MITFFTRWLDAWSIRNRALIRIADALERIAPLPEEPVALSPEDAVSYVDEEKIAERELAEEVGALEEWLREHPEQAEGTGAEDETQDDGGLGVYGRGNA